MRWLLALVVPALSVIAAPTDIPSAASFYVPDLPGLKQDPEHPLHIYSGHLSSDPNAPGLPKTDVTAHLFFVLVKNKRVADKERIMFWFNGGPGCSSFDGLMMEVGPWRLDGDSALKLVEGGWGEYTTMVYVDQPAGTGFSYAPTNKYVHGLNQASEQWMEFLHNFYLVFPEYQSMDTYLGGESYAGQYIPYFANAILESSLSVPLRGVAIGNGWMDVRRQYPSYLEYAVKHGIIEDKSPQWKEAKRATDSCMADARFKSSLEPVSIPACEGLLSKVLLGKERKVDGKDMCINIYDVRLEDTKPDCGMNWPAEIHNVTTYLDRTDVVRALHAEAKSESWVECRGRIHQEFQDYKSNSSVTLMPKVLEKIPMLIFAGDQDFICNYMGIESMIKEMTWNGAKGLGQGVQAQSWGVNGVPAGTWTQARNLTYVKIFNASHMAPYDTPAPAHDMILRFMGVDFSAIVEGSAKIPSTVGGVPKPIFLEGTTPTPAPAAGPPGASPEQLTAKWEAYYNAGSAALVLILVLGVIGLFMWCRVRRRQGAGGSTEGVQLPADRADEQIPLTTRGMDDDDDGEGEFRQRSNSKGKERERELAPPPIFDVGDSDDEDTYKSPRG